MGTEKFFVFKEDGTLARLKGRIVRFLDNDPPVNDDKANIRSSISVPASAEGLTPTNNLSDVSSAETSRDNLSLLSVDQIIESCAVKLNAPFLNYDGVNDYTEISDADVLTPSDVSGENDIPWTIEVNLTIEDGSADAAILSKFTTGGKEWALYNTSAGLRFLVSDGINNALRTTDTNLAAYSGKPIHICVTYGGSGPGRLTSFASAADAIKIYINGKEVSSTAVNNASYAGVSNTTQPVWIGRYSTNYGNIGLYNLKIHNREMSAGEVNLNSRGYTQLLSEVGGAEGGFYTSDFSVSVDSWTAPNGVIASVDSIGGKDDNLQMTVGSISQTYPMQKSPSLVTGNRYRIEFDYYLPSGNSNVNGFSLFDGASTSILADASAAQDTWTRATVEHVFTNTYLRVYPTEGGSTTISDAGGNDKFIIRNFTITDLGVVVDYRSENFDTSEGILRDASGNALNGTNNGATLTGARKHIAASTLNLTGLPTSSAGLSAGSVWNDSGTMKIV